MDRYSVIIIGGGPAGLFCAVHAAKDNRKILVLEKKPSCGRKLLLTGSGQCNITHEGKISDFLTHYGDNGVFLKPALLNFSNQDLIGYLEDQNLRTEITDNGKVFPKSKRAQDILDILLRQCRDNNVTILCDENVTRISHDSGFFLIKTDNNSFSGENLVIASGGASYPVTGSSGDGIILAGDLRQPVTPLSPALTPVYPDNYQFGDLSGISFENIRLSLFRNQKKMKDHSGDILFTHTGLSGPGILDLSRFIEPGDILKISFIPDMSSDLIRKNLIGKISEHGNRLIKTILMEYSLPERFIRKILELSGISPDLTAAHLSKESRTELIVYLAECPFTISGKGGFEEAMATRGGISLNGINPKTMESKTIPGLFCIGEALDIDGDTGGYNLQAAFSTAILSAKRITRNI